MRNRDTQSRGKDSSGECRALELSHYCRVAVRTWPSARSDRVALLPMAHSAIMLPIRGLPLRRKVPLTYLCQSNEGSSRRGDSVRQRQKWLLFSLCNGHGQPSRSWPFKCGQPRAG